MSRQPRKVFGFTGGAKYGPVADGEKGAPAPKAPKAAGAPKTAKANSTGSEDKEDKSNFIADLCHFCYG